MAIASPITSGDASDERAAGAPVTLEELWEHHDYLHALSRRIVGDPLTAEDVVQETYVRALRHLDRLDRDQSLRSWLATVARRCSIDELRRKTRHAVPVESVPDVEAAGGDEIVDAVLQRGELRAAWGALAELQPRERRLLLGRVAQDRSIAQLAAEEGSTERAVESVLSRARAKLSAAVERGAVLVAAPFTAMARWIRRKSVETTLDAEKGEATQVLAGRASELLAAGTAVVVLAAGLAIGGRANDGVGRVEASRRPDAAAPVPMFGIERSDPTATLDEAAAPRTAQVLAATLGSLLGLPAQDDSFEPTADKPAAAGSQPPSWWVQYAPWGGGPSGGHPRGPGDPDGPGGGAPPGGQEDPPILGGRVPLVIQPGNGRQLEAETIAVERETPEARGAEAQSPDALAPPPGDRDVNTPAPTTTPTTRPGDTATTSTTTPPAFGGGGGGGSCLVELLCEKPPPTTKL